MNSIEKFPTWTCVQLGGYKNADLLIAELERQGVRIWRWAWDIAAKLAMSPDGRNLELVTPAVHELGFPNTARFDRICERAREFGLGLVSQNAALYTALQAGEQVGRDELFVFAMESIIDSDGDREVFDLHRNPDDELVLSSRFGSPADRLFPDDRVVFSRT